MRELRIGETMRKEMNMRQEEEYGKEQMNEI